MLLFSNSMQRPVLISLFILNLATCASAQSACYVKSNNSSQECPDQPCLTFDQYIQETSSYFSTAATFIFLPGNHTAQTVLNLQNISNLTLKGEGKDSDVIVICSNHFIVLCSNMTNLTIEGLTIILNPSKLIPSFITIWTSAEVCFSKVTFIRENTQSLMRAVVSKQSSIKFISCFFMGGAGEFGGGIFAFDQSKITLDGSNFTGNTAVIAGGAIFAANSSVTIKGNFITNNSAPIGGAFSCFNCLVYVENHPITPDGILGNTADKPGILGFINNIASKGGAIALYYSNASLNGSTILFVANSATKQGGALFSEASQVTFKTKSLHFIRNRAEDAGGAIYSHANSSITLTAAENSSYFFTDNMCNTIGGAVFITEGNFNIIGDGFFTNWDSVGHETLTFAHNHATFGGGAVGLKSANVELQGIFTKFEHNKAESAGGGIYSVSSKFRTSVSKLHFDNNHAGLGGAIWSQDDTEIKISVAKFANNLANTGEALYFHRQMNAIFHEVTVTGHLKSALFIFESTVTFGGTIFFNNNEGLIGGAMYVIRSYITFTGYSLFEENKADLGGTIIAFHSQILFSGGVAKFALNTARAGGGIYASETDIIVNSTINFISNVADYGGAMYLSGTGTLILQSPYATLATANNHASEYGGVIFVDDTPTVYQCSIERTALIQFNNLPSCFMDLKGTDSLSISSHNDSAGKDGSFLYGGLLDRCRISSLAGVNGDATSPYKYLQSNIFHIEPAGDTIRALSSRPYQLCFCESDHEYDCSSTEKRTIIPGQRITVSLLAVAQGGISVTTQLTAIVSGTARLKPYQSIQILPSHCTEKNYNIFSLNDQEDLVLFPSDGPCRDTARAVINVQLLPCPDAFTQSGQECICEERLQIYGASCIVDDNIHIMRTIGSRFWMSALYINESYQGLILFGKCPIDYCTNTPVNITLDDLDLQCDHNRSGVLCGACATNYSLMLGGSQCQICSNIYLVLLLPFAAAGIALVVFLSFLRLTVATGMINSIMLYANIVQANKSHFLPNSRNVLTIFISWLNLDLGFQSCFYHGMDGYAQIWLQFIFPIYVWTLISLIIIISRYSITVTKLVGSNPIAVLSTLLLMSYTKILKIIIEVFSSVELDYPSNKTATVWLKDANVPYLKSKHLILTVITSLVLVVLLLPYTLFLLLGHKLYHFSGRKYFCWLIKIKPLLDAYYAPYEDHTRYWTGLLLLARCLLYIIFSFNSLGGTAKSHLAIIITFTAVLILAWLSTRIYKSRYTNIIEATIYLNLITLSATTLADVNSPSFVYTLVAVVFCTTLGIIMYQFYKIHIAKSAVWLRTEAKIIVSMTRITRRTSDPHPLKAPAGASSHDPHKIVTKSVIDLRELLLSTEI